MSRTRYKLHNVAVADR